MKRVRIRGIYSTALTEIFSSLFSVVQQSFEIAERFMQEIREEPADITIKDGEDKGTLIIMSDDDIYEDITNVFKNSFIWKSPVKLYSVIEPKEDCTYFEFKVEPCINKGLVVKVPYGDNKIGLSEPKAVSKYAMLWKGKGYTTFSEHIRQDEDRTRLLQLSKSLNKKGYNVKWRSNAKFVNLAELKSDLDNLLLRYNSEDFRNQGEEFYIINISLIDKLYLDYVRKRIVNTVKFHHMLKLSYGREVDIIEENGGSPAKLLEGLVSEFLNIEHIKADGKVLHLTGGKVLEKNIGENRYIIKLRRDLKEGGILDGINERITKGTYDIVEYDSEKWYQIHRYFNNENKLIGIYVNISTPPELLRGKIRYLDLEIDVVIKDSEIIVLDEDELEKKSKYMPPSLLSRAKEVLNDIVKMAKENKLT